jgi:putative SOS response-associated peptidase YedK
VADQFGGRAVCGRYTLRAPGKLVADLFGLAGEPALTPRYNIAPTQPVPVIRVLRANPATRERELVPLRWGLVPPWADDPAIGNRLINARAETVAGKPSFRAAFKYRRCLVPADGFYEWRKEGGKKQPLYVRRKDGRPFAFAGLWERWERAGEVIESCAIITTGANDLMGEFHDRMPVILRPEDYDLWLDPVVQEPKLVEPLLKPCPGDELEAYPLSRLVNDARTEDPRCVEPQG